MNTYRVVSKAEALKAFSIVCVLTLLVLTACSSPHLAAQAPEAPAEPANPPPTGSHPPVILRVVGRDEVIDGFQFIYDDIYFSDPDGDAVAVTYRQISSTLPHPIPLSDDPIAASVEAQKGEAQFPVGGKCRQKMELVLEVRIRDRAGNLSEPVTFQMSCVIPPVVDVKSILVGGLGIAFSIALILLLGFWLLFRNRPAERLPALRSMLLLSCLLLPLKFMQSILHEGGHALYTAAHGIPVIMYVHPFTFSAYARPVIDSSILTNVSGSLTVLLLSLFISLPFWKRRSVVLLPLVMFFPFVALYDGVNILGVLGGDFWNVAHVNGLSPIPFYLIGALLVIVGMILLFALFPLLGLDPKDKKSMFVIPAAVFLVGVLSILAACVFVPGSPINRQYFLTPEILAGVIPALLLQTIFWMILAVLYATLYPRIIPKLPDWLPTEPVQLVWKDLRLPALLAFVSVILGLIIIT